MFVPEPEQGFVVREDGVIATNFHVIGLHRGFSVRLADGKTYEPTAILATDRKRDLAIIKIEAKGFNRYISVSLLS